MRRKDRSEALFEAAKDVLVGGVNSPVRSFGRVGGTPRFIRRAQGSRVWDEDGNGYVDYVMAWGPNILGHAPAAVVRAVTEAVAEGLGFGAPTEREVRIAQEVRRRMPSIERLRLVTSGTEATMSALRLARAATRRDRFIKFEGAYHGHADPFLSKAGSGLATTGLPDSAGVPAEVAQAAITVPYNSADRAEAEMGKRGDEIAAIIVEPVAGNMGVIPPAADFLARLRETCDDHGALLIFDEVITGFRVARGGAQERFGVRPDLTTLGKVLGGGLPLAAYGGREDVMRLVAPEGPVYQAGTMAGNPLAVAAGLATLGGLDEAAYDRLESTSARLVQGIQKTVDGQAVVHRVASMMGLFLTPGPVNDYAGARRTDAARYARLFHGLLDEGIYLAPSPYEALFVSTAHSSDDLNATLDAFSRRWAASAIGPSPTERVVA